MILIFYKYSLRHKGKILLQIEILVRLLYVDGQVNLFSIFGLTSCTIVVSIGKAPTINCGSKLNTCQTKMHEDAVMLVHLNWLTECDGLGDDLLYLATAC